MFVDEDEVIEQRKDIISPAHHEEPEVKSPAVASHSSSSALTTSTSSELPTMVGSSTRSQPIRETSLPGPDATKAADTIVSTTGSPEVSISAIKEPSNVLANLSPSSMNKIAAPSKGQAPPTTTDPMTFDQTIASGYAKYEENKDAKRLMQSEEWRGLHTAVNEGFLEGYYQNSRYVTTVFIILWVPDLLTPLDIFRRCI